MGNLPYLSTNLSENSILMLKCAEKYGPICRVRFGSLDIVFLTDYQIIKRAFTSAEFTDRPKVLFYDILSSGFKGILFSNGNLWSEHRRFNIRHLRELGVGLSRMEYAIQEELEAFNQELLEQTADGSAIEMVKIINIFVLNVIWNIITGIFPVRNHRHLSYKTFEIDL